MSTQYNKIRAPYDHIRKRTIALIEHQNVETTLSPIIKNARVLELACGSAFYTYDFIKWGASSVLAVDVSAVMIEEAKRIGSSSIESSVNQNVEFLLSDCSTPHAYVGGPFDIVFGAWFLNYAADRAALVDMFRNIALNLADGGHFVGITIVPSDDPVASVAAELRARPPGEGGSGGLFYEDLRPVGEDDDDDDGISVHVRGITPVGEVNFDCFYLKKGVYEEAAREAGLRGEFEWGVTSVPERFLEGKGPGGASVEEVRSYVDVPNYGVLVITK